MTAENCTVFAEFIFLGLSGRQDVQQGLFVLFLLVHIITVVANVGMVLLIKRDPRLHTPMYYFLSNLSFCNICYSSTISPKMLADFLSEQKKDSIWCMCHPDVLLWSLWRCGMSHVGCHGLMTVMWPFAIHFFIQLPCPGESVPSLWLLPTS